MIINDNYFLEDFLECDIDCYSSSPLLLLRPDINLYHVNKILSRLFAYHFSYLYENYLSPGTSLKVLCRLSDSYTQDQNPTSIPQIPQALFQATLPFAGPLKNRAVLFSYLVHQTHPSFSPHCLAAIVDVRVVPATMFPVRNHSAGPPILVQMTHSSFISVHPFLSTCKTSHYSYSASPALVLFAPFRKQLKATLTALAPNMAEPEPNWKDVAAVRAWLENRYPVANSQTGSPFLQYLIDEQAKGNKIRGRETHLSLGRGGELMKWLRCFSEHSQFWYGLDSMRVTYYPEFADEVEGESEESPAPESGRQADGKLREEGSGAGRAKGEMPLIVRRRERGRVTTQMLIQQSRRKMTLRPERRRKREQTGMIDCA